MYRNIIILNIILFFAFSSMQSVAAHFQNRIYETNRKHLVDIIKSLNGNTKDYGSSKLNSGNGDENELNDEEKEEKLQEILWLLKKNYKAGVQHNKMMNNLKNSGARVYLIKNPEILNEYKSYLRTTVEPYSSEESFDVSGYRKSNLKEKVEKARKDAGIHLELTEKSDSDDIEKNEDKKKDNEMKIAETKDKSDADENIRLDSLDIHNREHLNVEIEDDSEDLNDRKEKLNSESAGATSYRSRRSDDENDKITKEIDIETTLGPKKVKSHLPKHKSKKAKSKMRSNLSHFGRTSIPLVGKKNVYEDK